MTTRTDRAAAGFLTSIVQLSTVAVLQLLLVPVVVQHAGQETLGAYAAFSQAVVLMSLMDFGFGVAGSRFMARAFGQEDGGAAFTLALNAARKFYIYMSVAYASVAVLLAAQGPRLLSLHGTLAEQARIAFLATAIWGLARIPLMAYPLALIGCQRLAAFNLLTTFGNACRIVASIIFVIAGGGFLSLIAGNILGEAITLITQRRAFQRSQMGSVKHSPPPAAHLFKEILSFSGHAMLLNLLYYLTFYSDSIFVSYLYGPAVAAAYFATVVPAQQAWTLILRLMNNSVPGLNEILAKGDWEGARAGYYRLCRYSLLLASALGLGILGFNRVLIGIWVGPERYMGDSITVLLAILVPWSVLENVQIQFLLAIGRTRLLSRLCLLEGCLKITLSLVLGRLMGPQGVLLGTLVASISIAPWLWRENLRSLGTSPLVVVRASLLPVLAYSIPLAVISIFLFVMPPVSLAAWALALAVFGSAWCASSWFGALSTGDQSYLREAVSKLRLSRSVSKVQPSPVEN
ncbi:MAG: oligosaccharide flippase family protein [Bryobacteraceae bacterium]